MAVLLPLMHVLSTCLGIFSLVIMDSILLPEFYSFHLSGESHRVSSACLLSGI